MLASTVFQELLELCSQRIGEKEVMTKRFSLLLQLVEDIPFQIIKVAGTNGKGSVSAMLAACLAEDGKRVGLFTSPHLVSINERFVVNGEQANGEKLTAIATTLKEKLHDFINTNGVAFTPSFFEVLILMAIDYFAQEKVEIAIIEAGIGGTNDSTSLLPSVLSLITTIGLDHKEQLGDTLASVARDKAGIAKSHTPLMINTTMPEDLKEVITQKARARSVQVMESNTHVIAYKTSLEGTQAIAKIQGQIVEFQPSLLGNYQQENINLVISAWCFLADLGIVNTFEALYALNKVTWKARFEVVNLSNKWILDGAHNPPAMEALVSALDQLSSIENRVLLFGNSDGKEYQQVLQYAPQISKRIFLVDDFHKAIPQATLQAHLPNRMVMNSGASNIEEAIATIQQDYPTDVIVITGSLFMVGLAREILVG